LFPDTLKQLKECVRHNEYVATLHAEEEMDEDELSIFDIERAILTGEIVGRQKDEEKSEWKYLVRGQTVDEGQVIVVAVTSSPQIGPAPPEISHGPSGSPQEHPPVNSETEAQKDRPVVLCYRGTW
jgi:hypothetical protein